MTLAHESEAKTVHKQLTWINCWLSYFYCRHCLNFGFGDTTSR